MIIRKKVVSAANLLNGSRAFFFLFFFLSFTHKQTKNE